MHRIYCEALSKTRDRLEKNPYQNNMNSFHTEARTNIKFMAHLEWKKVEIIDALQKAYGDNVPNRALVCK